MKLIALMKKEFLRFFKDPKLLATMLLPGILIYVLYSVMGSAMWDQSKGYDFKVAATSLPPSVERLFDGALPEGWSLEWLDVNFFCVMAKHGFLYFNLVERLIGIFSKD